jgi:hypothetical protein
MKKLFFKIITIITPIVLVNLTIGIIRNQNGDNTIPFKQNWLKQFITHNQIEGRVGLTISDSQTFDMSREVRHFKIYRFRDKWGFQNLKDLKNPQILFIGDSFLDDPYLSYDNGLSYNFSNSMNIACMGCSGFTVYNELKSHGYFNKVPKLIIIEIVERNLYNWSKLFGQIENNLIQTSPYRYAGLDFVFGNNFKGATYDNLSYKNKTPKKQGVLRNINGYKSIYFYRNKIAKYDINELESITHSMKKSSLYFNKKGCKVVFLVAPDKESIFPEIFPQSNLPLIQKKFDELGIQYIDMFKAIMQSPKRRECYFEGDTHWNQNAYSLLIKQIKTLIGSQDVIFEKNQNHQGSN